MTTRMSTRRSDAQSRSGRSRSGPADVEPAIPAVPSKRKTFINLQKVEDAIVFLANKKGSSKAAIKKYILAKYGYVNDKDFNDRIDAALKGGLQNKRSYNPEDGVWTEKVGSGKLLHPEGTEEEVAPKEVALKEVAPKMSLDEVLKLFLKPRRGRKVTSSKTGVRCGTGGVAPKKGPKKKEEKKKEEIPEGPVVGARGEDDYASLKMKRVCKFKRVTTVNKLVEKMRPGLSEYGGRCVRAAIQKGFINVEGTPDDWSQVVFKDVEVQCGHKVEVTLGQLLSQPDYGGNDKDELEDATISCGTAECEAEGKAYLSGMCLGSAFVNCGRSHNHCRECPQFGKCIMDYREMHCDKCKGHYFGGRIDSYNCRCQGDQSDFDD